VAWYGSPAKAFVGARRATRLKLKHQAYKFNKSARTNKYERVMVDFLFPTELAVSNIMVPKLIIQTGPPDLPLLLKSAMTTVRLLNPDFEYRFFDDTMIEDFFKTYFPEHYDDYRSFRYRIQRYDFFRYLALYRFGGFYLDLDMFLVKSLAPLLDFPCTFAFEELSSVHFLRQRYGMDWQLGNYAFAAEPGHPFLGAIIENCLRAQKDPVWVKPMMQWLPPTVRTDFYILNTSGPGLVSRTFAENPQLVKDVNVLFPPDVCDRASWHQFGSFGVHHMAGSWRSSQRFLALRITRIWEYWTLKRILDEGRTRGSSRRAPGALAVSSVATHTPEQGLN